MKKSLNTHLNKFYFRAGSDNSWYWEFLFEHLREKAIIEFVKIKFNHIDLNRNDISVYPCKVNSYIKEYDVVIEKCPKAVFGVQIVDNLSIKLDIPQMLNGRKV